MLQLLSLPQRIATVPQRRERPDTGEALLRLAGSDASAATLRAANDAFEAAQRGPTHSFPGEN